MLEKNIKVKLNGVLLTPHLYPTNGCYVASESRFKVDYKYVNEAHELIPHILEGLSVRMSSDLKRSHPKLICSEIILKQNPHLKEKRQ